MAETIIIHKVANLAAAQILAKQLPGHSYILTQDTTQLYVTDKNTNVVTQGVGGYVLPAAAAATLGGVLKAAVVANTTDSSGGTSGGNTIAVVTDVPSTANAIATLAAKLNALQTSLRTAGILT